MVTYVVHTVISSMKECGVLIISLFYLGKKNFKNVNKYGSRHFDMVGSVVVAEKSLAFEYVFQDLVAQGVVVFWVRNPG